MTHTGSCWKVDSKKSCLVSDYFNQTRCGAALGFPHTATPLRLQRSAVPGQSVDPPGAQSSPRLLVQEMLLLFGKTLDSKTGATRIRNELPNRDSFESILPFPRSRISRKHIRLPQ